MVFNPGTIANSTTDNAVPETLTIVYRAVVLNVSGNQSAPATALNNSAVLSWANGTLAPVSAPTIAVVEPSLTVSKSLALTGPGDASDQVDYTITIANTAASSTTAFDVQLTDVLPAQIDWATASIVSVSGTAAANFTY